MAWANSQRRSELAVSPATPPRKKSWEKKRAADLVIDLDVNDILPNQVAHTQDADVSIESDTWMDLEDEPEERALADINQGAELWKSMQSQDENPARQQLYPTPPDRRTHDWHIKRIDRLQRTVAAAPDLFEFIVMHKRSHQIIDSHVAGGVQQSQSW